MPMDFIELSTDWKEKILQLWNSSLPCKRIKLEHISS